MAFSPKKSKCVFFNFLLEAYTPQQLEFGTGGGSQVDRMVSLKSLQEELKGLDFEIDREVIREIHEGKYHKRKI